ILSGFILMLFSKLMHISGYNTDEAESLLLIGQTTGLRVRDLLYSGILIASLGAIMDIAMSVVSSMNELKLHKPESSAMVLFKAGMNVGKDVIGTMSNTLILAFTGTSINLLIVLSSYSVQYNQFMNMNRTAIEITQALAGSLALVLTVPITALLASHLLIKKKAH
ncbi:MAG: YibE/F family protein, partial [Spirochaetales bacterium]|nr:YibE/F family protein [Spirochaetales bacterium]